MACYQMGARRPTIRDLCSESEMVASTPHHHTRPSGEAAWFLEEDDGAAAMDSLGHHHFLDECHMCGRHLAEDGDIYMYRGDTAFCSEECREEQIQMDQYEERANRRRRRRAAKNAAAAVASAMGSSLSSSSVQVESQVVAVAVSAV